MTATVQAPPAGPRPSTAAPGPGHWAGTGALLRLYLRLDRLRIVLWTAGVLLLSYGSLASLESTYATPEAVAARAALMTNPSALLMGGPAIGYEAPTFGAVLVVEMALFLFCAVAVMSILLAVRHTRADEEAGRLELVRALPVGRYAPAGAALLTVAIADVLAGGAVVLALLPSDRLDLPGTLAMGAGTALTGMVFAAVAAVAAQVTEHARAATGMSVVALVVLFLVRGVGDVLDAQGSWLSWLSPLAWAQQTRMYVDLRWWPLLLSATVTLLLLAVAVRLARRRDLGAGLRRPRPGRAAAAAGLLSAPGVALRLLTGSFVAWTVGTTFAAVVFGSLASSLEDFVADIPEIGDWITIDLADLTATFAASVLPFLVVAPLVSAVSAVLRLRAEESAGRTELLLVTGTSRHGLLTGWLAVAGAQTVMMTLLTGLGLGAGVAAATGDARWVPRMAAAAAAYLPAILLVGAAAAMLLGLRPALAGLVWVVVGWVVVTAFLGQMLGLPQWAMNLSPVAHTPLVPYEDAAVLPLAVMSVATAVLGALAVGSFRRRDVGTT